MAFIKKKPKERIIDHNIEQITTPLELERFATANGIDVSPLNLPDVVDKLGIKLRFEPMDGDDSGSLAKDKKTGKWIMTINSLHHPNRQRFTIAHELGHYIQHSVAQDEFNDSVFFRNGESNLYEIEANQFAAQLLMPEQKFREFIESVSQEVDVIADAFQVSTMAVRVRAKQLGYKGHNL